MSEPFKIRVGSKSNKGTLKSENDDRILIGMDPAANDWLFSPDPVQVGEFGTVLLLADGLGDNENGGSAAYAICKTIKKLFDETLELPPYDDEKLRLLLKFFQIAQKQLQNQSLEHPAYKNIGASATIVLLLENKAFIVWLGNCRAYRYNSKGVDKSFFSDLPNLELLTVDHTFETEKVLFDDYREEKYFYPPGISKYVSSDLISHDISVSVVSLKKKDRILICSEGLFNVLSNDILQDILSSSEDPEICADVLISRAFNNGSEKNISAIVTDILEVESGIPVIENSENQLIEKARLLYGTPVANEVLPALPKETIPVIKEKTNSHAEDLVPVKLRTVMPEPEPDSPGDEQISGKEENTEKIIPSGGQIAIEWPVENQAEHIDQPLENEEIEENPEEEIEEEIEDESVEPVFSNEEIDESIVTPINTEVPASQIQGEMAERLARLKIKMTVYPDPEDKTQENTNKTITESNTLTSVDDPSKFISIDLNDEMEETGEIEEPEELSPFGEPIDEGSVENEDEDEIDEYIESYDEDQEEFDALPETFESAIIPESEDVIIDIQDDAALDSAYDDDEFYNEEYTEDPVAELPEEEEVEKEDEEDEEDEEEEEEEEIEWVPIVASTEIPVKQIVSEIPVEETTHAGAPVQKPIAHLIGADKDDNSPGTSEKKSKLWPYFVVLGFLILIPIWICRDNSELSSDNNMNGASAALSIDDENTEKQSIEAIPLETEPVPEPEPEDNEVEETEIVNPPASVVPDPETAKPKDKKKEEIKPKTDSRQPKYDADVEKNKHQLLGEVQSLLQQKNQLCKQISTYGRNAPESKAESTKQLQNKCDQLGQKFSSIYDQKSGFFKTVRYDFMKGTIKSIRVSMEQIEQQFKTIREE